LNFVSTWNVVAPAPGVGALVAAGVGVGALVAAGVGVGTSVAAGVGVGVPAWGVDEVADVIAELPTGDAPQPPSPITLRMTAAEIRTRTLVKRSGGLRVTDWRLVAGGILCKAVAEVGDQALQSSPQRWWRPIHLSALSQGIEPVA